MSIAAALLLGWGCSEEPAEPVARLAVASPEVTLPHGQRVPFELRFEPLRELGADAGSPLVFTHLLDGDGEVVRTFDHALRGSWQSGEALVDRFALQQSVIAPALPAGDYRLTVGLYDGGDRRWALQTPGEEVAPQEYAVARVRVPEIDPAAPRFGFSSEWHAIEAGEDKQAMARRWLSGDGSIEVQGVPVPSAVWMTLRLPSSDLPLRLVLEEGATTPTVRVDTDCSGFAATLSGGGFHHVTVPVGTVPCRIRFDANFAALGREAGRKLSVALEQMAWQQGAATDTDLGSGAIAPGSSEGQPAAGAAPAPFPSPSAAPFPSPSPAPTAPAATPSASPAGT